MALPKAVQQQIDAADRLVDQINGKEPGDPETGTNNPPTDPPVDPPQDPPQDPPNDPPPQANNDVSKETKTNAITDETWEKKYYVLQGKFDAEVPRLHQQLREMQAQMQQIIADKAALEAQKATEPQKIESLITEQDKEAFGPDLIDLIDRATESKVATLREREAELMKEIGELKGKLGDVTQRQGVSDQDRFLMGLGQQVPDWEVLNVDSGFLGWLQEVDPVYGLPRKVALQTAYENFDVNRVATIFKAYKQILPPTPAPNKAKEELQRQVAPTRTRSTTPPTNGENQQYFTQADIEQFYTDWRRGHYTDEEAASMEKQIHAAAAEGRIR